MTIVFVQGYLRMILWKISTAISIKHRILVTFNIKKKFNSDSLKACNIFNKSPLTYVNFLFLHVDSACAKLFVDEESTWHNSNRGRTNTLTDSIWKRHKKEDSASFV
jgi:hypothetical protein